MSLSITPSFVAHTTAKAADMEQLKSDIQTWANNLQGSTEIQSTLGYAEITANVTSGATTAGVKVDITGLSVTVTVPSGGRRVRITGVARLYCNSGADDELLYIYESATMKSASAAYSHAINNVVTVVTQCVITPTAGSHTYNLKMAPSANTGINCEAGATFPSFIHVELI